MRALQIIWGVVFIISSISWAFDAVRVLFFNYHPNGFEIGVALIITAFTVAKWAYNAIVKEEW